MLKFFILVFYIYSINYLNTSALSWSIHCVFIDLPSTWTINAKCMWGLHEQLRIYKNSMVNLEDDIWMCQSVFLKILFNCKDANVKSTSCFVPIFIQVYHDEILGIVNSESITRFCFTIMWLDVYPIYSNLPNTYFTNLNKSCNLVLLTMKQSLNKWYHAYICVHNILQL